MGLGDEIGYHQIQIRDGKEKQNNRSERDENIRDVKRERESERETEKLKLKRKT